MDNNSFHFKNPNIVLTIKILKVNQLVSRIKIIPFSYWKNREEWHHHIITSLGIILSLFTFLAIFNPCTAHLHSRKERLVSLLGNTQNHRTIGWMLYKSNVQKLPIHPLPVHYNDKEKEEGNLYFSSSPHLCCSVSLAVQWCCCFVVSRIPSLNNIFLSECTYIIYVHGLSMYA